MRGVPLGDFIGGNQLKGVGGTKCSRKRAAASFGTYPARVCQTHSYSFPGKAPNDSSGRPVTNPFFDDILELPRSGPERECLLM